MEQQYDALPAEHTGGAAERVKSRTEKSVLAFCGQAGLFPPVDKLFADPRAAMGSCAIFGPGSNAPRHVVAAVSGGADSMALLHILLALAPALALYVTAVHVNHGLRGAAADRDEAFVRAECARLGVPLVVCSAKADGRSIPQNAGEDWARRLRYGYLDGFVAEKNVLVATAHTLSDQAETLLFRLARGTGAHGAAGIRPKRGMYIRPLLCLTRQDTEAYCRAVRQPFVTDETNLVDTYARNRIRHAAVPALEAANTGAVRNLGAFCAKMAEVDAYFAARAEILLREAAEAAQNAAQHVAQPPFSADARHGPWALETLQAAEPLILRAALHSLVSPVRDAEEKYIRLLADAVLAGRGAVQLRKDLRFAVRGALLAREQSAPQPAALAVSALPEMPLSPGDYDFGGGYCFRVSLVNADFSEKTQSVHKKDLKNEADYAKIPMLTVFRTRAPGDTFRPAGRGGKKSLKKWQNEQKTPTTERYRQPLLAADGEVLWLWDCGFAEGLAPEENTKKVLRILPLTQAEESKK
ncbi:MAG: tRNA lysidine(34) synthetase TilS [Faecalibacterium sp.]|jgi:tRNA(Ile)-lysidine synthase|nr:tRNA lysidine(34) synthetase TilS [Faecalibacterium sp.]